MSLLLENCRGEEQLQTLIVEMGAGGIQNLQSSLRNPFPEKAVRWVKGKRECEIVQKILRTKENVQFSAEQIKW